MVTKIHIYIYNRYLSIENLVPRLANDKRTHHIKVCYAVLLNPQTLGSIVGLTITASQRLPKTLKIYLY